MNPTSDDFASQTSLRKRAHLEACLHDTVECPDTRAWAAWQLRPECFPEMALDDVRLSTRFLDKELSFPFLIAAMTGGGGDLWNHNLAAVAQSQRVALCLGSMRCAVDDTTRIPEFDVKHLAPDVPVLGNIGVWELRDAAFADRLLDLAVKLGLDAITVHVNPAQELVQQNGQRSFSGALLALETFISRCPLPVLLKEVGMGLSTRHVPQLLNLGLYALDVAGRGGTHFVRVEAARAPQGSDEEALAQALWSWGRPTPELLHEFASALRMLPVMGTTPTLIASGGIRSAQHMAVAFALGAELVSSARPLWTALHQEGPQGVERWITSRRNQLQALCLLCGATTPAGLRGLALPARLAPVQDS